MTAPVSGSGTWWRSGRTRAVVALVITLLVGLALGAALDRRLIVQRMRHRAPGFGDAFDRNGPPRMDVRRVRDRLSHDLKLDTVQAARLDSIMSRRVALFRAVRAETQGRVRAMMDTTDTMIDSMLTPAQREQFRVIRARRAAWDRDRDRDRDRNWGGRGRDEDSGPADDMSPARHAP